MSSKINPYNIDTTFPVAGQNNPTQGFRTNFLGIQNNFLETSLEINDLLNKVIVSAPLTYGANANINNFGGSSISNVAITDFGYGVSDHGTISTSETVAFDYTQGYYHSIDIEGIGTTITVNPANFPNLGYSELVIEATTNSVPAYINLNNLTSSSNIMVGYGIAGYDNSSNTFTLTNPNPYHLVLGSTDGLNWELSVKNNGPVVKAYTPSSSLGAIGDTKGMIVYDSTHIYICVGNYNGTSVIWKRVSFGTF
jgi:hypothetical protein